MSVKVEGYQASEYFSKIENFLNNTPSDKKQALLKKSAGVYQFDIKDGSKVQTWALDFKNAGTVSTTPPKKADITITLDDKVFVDLANGKITGQKAFMTGKLKAKGNLNLATKLDAFFTEVRKSDTGASSSAPQAASSKPATSSGSVEVEGYKASQVFKQIHAWLNSLPEAERKNQVSKIKGLFQLDVKGAKGVQSWTLDLKNGQGDIYVGKAKTKADAIISVADNDFVSMSQGKLTGQKAFMTGKLKVKGQMMLATKLDTVFKNLPSAKL